MKKFLENTASAFFLLVLFFIPLNFDGKGFQNAVTQFFFARPVGQIQQVWFAFALHPVDFSSDTIALNLLIALLLLIAFLLAIAMRLFKAETSTFTSVVRIITAFYLAFILLKYGLDKIVKAQFYLPEPNILCTLFGNLTKDILFWSTMGTSRGYSILTGLIELATGLLLLSRRTRIFGGLIAIAIFMNILIINIGFDISVKTYSLILLGASFYLLAPSFKSFYVFFILQRQAILPANAKLFKSRAWAVGAKTFVIGLILVEVFYPYALSGNWNDDQAPRPLLHGAYEVKMVVEGKDTLRPVDFPANMVFIHRNKYLIFREADGKMRDFRLTFNASKKQFEVQNESSPPRKIDFKYSRKDSLLEVYIDKPIDVRFRLKMVNWRKMPAVDDNFHYTIDAVK